MDLSKYSTEELKSILAKAENDALLAFNMEQCIKRIINSIYGAFGNQWFHFYNIRIAESIAGQGRDVIKHAEIKLNDYFKTQWHTDTKLHDAIGVSNVQQLTKNASVYIDTDSLYITFEDIINSCDTDKSPREFILDIDDNHLAKFFNDTFDVYADDNGVKSFMSLDMESIADKAIWVKKKKYIQNIIWEDGKNLSGKLVTKGLEIIQSSTPSFSRKKLKDLMDMIFNMDNIEMDKYVAVLKKIKDEFDAVDVEEISKNNNINNYHTHIINDSTEVEIAPKCPIHVRAAAAHNYLLKKNNLLNKYNLIKSGDKIRWYKVKGEGSEVFGYLPSAFPYEFAPEADRDIMFETTILTPLNRILGSTDVQELNRSLMYTGSLF